MRLIPLDPRIDMLCLYGVCGFQSLSKLISVLPAAFLWFPSKTPVLFQQEYISPLCRRSLPKSVIPSIFVFHRHEPKAARRRLVIGQDRVDVREQRPVAAEIRMPEEVCIDF